MGAILETGGTLAALAPAGPLMALDLGTRTIGVAVSDTRRRIASPLVTIRRKARLTPDLHEILAMAEARGVAAFVLGLPRNMDGSEGPRCDSTRSFARSLARLTDRPILLWDERLSTVAAEAVLIATGTTRKRRDEIIDRHAAAHILEAALAGLAGGAEGTPEGR